MIPLLEGTKKKIGKRLLDAFFGKFGGREIEDCLRMKKSLIKD